MRKMKPEMKNQEARTPIGFTLIELLVVIANITLPAAVLFPVLGRGKASLTLIILFAAGP
jgi:type II secretory pathway pseudopilin PulG